MIPTTQQVADEILKCGIDVLNVTDATADTDGVIQLTDKVSVQVNPVDGAMSITLINADDTLRVFPATRDVGLLCVELRMLGLGWV